MKKALLIIVTLSLSIFAQAQSWDEITKALPLPYATTNNNGYGNEISIDGNYAVVGAYYHQSNKGVAYVLFYDGSNWITQAQLSASDGATGKYFGNSVSISGDNIVIGSFADNANGSTSGSAFVFTKPITGWTDMTETAKLLPSDGGIGKQFGCSVSISANNIVVGSRIDTPNGSQSGSAYVFTKSGMNWSNMTQTAKLLPSDGAAYDWFGIDVSISGNSIVIGSYKDDDNGSNSGSAYVFTKSGMNWGNMTQTAKLLPSDGATNDLFGQYVSISGNDIVVGATGSDNIASNSGSAYVFTKVGMNWSNMTQTAKLTVATGAVNESLGGSVDISANSIVLGATGNSDNGYASGTAYVFTKSGGNWVNMTETAKVSASDGTAYDVFGGSVGISGDKILIGSYQKQSVYAFSKQGMNWTNMTEIEKTYPYPIYNNSNHYYGYSVAVDGNYAVVGSIGYDNNKGSANVLFFDGTNWVAQATLTASDGATYDEFGCSVSISGDNIVVGAYKNDDNGNSSGSAYVFTKPITGWVDANETGKLLLSGAISNDYFGFSVSISGDDIIIGAYGRNDIGSNSGAVYEFKKPVSGWTNMTQTSQLQPNGVNSNDYFGYSVCVSGNTLVVGTPGDDVPGANSGSAFVYVKTGSSWGGTYPSGRILPSDGAAHDYFGNSVSVSGNDIVVGANQDNVNGYNNAGSAYVFTKPNGGWSSITETAKILPSDVAGYEYYGGSVSISGDNIVVGAYRKNANSGSVYVYTKPLTGWVNTTETDKLVASDGITNDNFGFSVCISGNNIVGGARNNYGNDTLSGSAYFFRPTCSTISILNVIECDSYLSPSGKTFSTSNTYLDTIPNAAMCDSLITINLTIMNSATQTIALNLCSGNNHTYADGTSSTNITTNENHTSTLSGQAANGCDSVVTENINVLPVAYSTVNTNVCSGNNHTYADGTNSTNITTNENHTSTLLGQASNGCDSVVTENINVLPVAYSTINTNVCSGNNHTYADGTSSTNITTNENHTSTLLGQASNGCDSVITENINVLPVAYSTVNTNVCSGNNHTFADGTSSTNITTNENHTSTLIGQASNGCDSVITENINVLPLAITNQAITSCDEETINGNVYTSSQIVNDILSGQAANGCDSIVITDLTINNSYAITIDTTINQGSSFVVGTSTYNSDGSYVDSLTTGENCDSIITTNLTVYIDGIASSLSNGLTVYPNPANETISVKSESNAINSISIIDLQGREFINIDQIQAAEKSINISDLAGGIYFVKINFAGGEQEILRLVKMK